jgi:hypothetical protein
MGILPNTDVSVRNHFEPQRFSSSLPHAPVMKLIHRSLVAIIALEVHSILAQAPHNLTTIVGTWSSGAGAVLTGAVSFFVAFDEEAFLMKTFRAGGLCKSRKLDLQSTQGTTNILWYLSDVCILLTITKTTGVSYSL